MQPLCPIKERKPWKSKANTGGRSAPTTLIVLELSKQMRYCNMSSILACTMTSLFTSDSRSSPRKFHRHSVVDSMCMRGTGEDAVWSLATENRIRNCPRLGQSHQTIRESYPLFDPCGSNKDDDDDDLRVSVRVTPHWLVLLFANPMTVYGKQIHY
ncbi:hypothetical protein KCU93_g194, partial [Aureobasidium melanogenum]